MRLISIGRLVSLFGALTALPLSCDASTNGVEMKAAVDRLSECINLTTTGDDQLIVSRMIILALASHPSVSKDVKIARETIENAREAFTHLVMSVLTIRCRAEVKAVAKESDVPFAFGEVGNALALVAMQKFVNDPNVLGAIKQPFESVDIQKLVKAIEQ